MSLQKMVNFIIQEGAKQLTVSNPRMKFGLQMLVRLRVWATLGQDHANKL
jgi:hypothetical protein